LRRTFFKKIIIHESLQAHSSAFYLKLLLDVARSSLPFFFRLRKKKRKKKKRVYCFLLLVLYNVMMFRA